MTRKCHENAMNIVMNGKGIPYVWFSPFEDGGVHEVKDMTGEKQVVTDPTIYLR
jgi:hypothetical protein